MVGSLADALHQNESIIALALPLYRCVPRSGLEPASPTISAELTGLPRFEGHQLIGRLLKTRTSGGILVYFLDCPILFDRPGIYGEEGRDYPDNAERFIGFCRLLLEGLKTSLKNFEDRWDILHAHEWQTGIVPLLLKSRYANDPFFQGTKTVFTVHNMAYQGLFPAEDFSLTGLPPDDFRHVEFFGKTNLLKAGLNAADILTTVSPAYAREAMTSQDGCGLEGILKERSASFFGILNGIDTHVWNPEADPHLAARFSAADVSGKSTCKSALQREMGLPERTDVPLFAMMSRLAAQKGVDFAIEAVGRLTGRQAQWIFVGAGDPTLESAMKALAASSPEKIAVKIVFDENLAHRIEAGADFFLMPSRFEPCGFNQMYSQSYGTVPIVRATGGLKDTVVDADEDPQNGTGLVFGDASAEALQAALERAFRLWEDPERLADVRRWGMTKDFSWKKSARQYLQLYERLLG